MVSEDDYLRDDSRAGGAPRLINMADEIKKVLGVFGKPLGKDTTARGVAAALAREGRGAEIPKLNLRQERATIQNVPIERVEGLDAALPSSDDQSLPVASNELHFNNGTISIDGDSNGFNLTVLSGSNAGAYFYVDNAGNVAIVSKGNITTYFNANTSLISIGNGSHSISIDPSLIAHDMTIQEIDVCSSGVAKKMLILASAAY